MYKLLIVKNRFTKSLNLKRGLDWFKNNTPIEITTEEISTDFDVTTFQIQNATYKGVICGEDIYPKLRTVIPEGKYHAVVFIYGNKLDGIRVNAAPHMPLYPGTDLIQLCNTNDGGKALNHEIFHTFIHRLQRQQVMIEDPMDSVVYEGVVRPYFNNGSINAKPSNRSIALERIAPYWDKITNIITLNSIYKMYKPKNFQLKELVSKATLDKYGEQSWQFLDERVLKNIQYIREQLGPITINTPLLQQRCFDAGEERGPHSQHCHGRAIDFSVKGMTAEEVRVWLKANFNKLPEPNIWVEKDVTWVHMDVRYSDIAGIHFFNP